MSQIQAGRIYSSMGANRAQMAANILTKSIAWREYETVHAPAFKAANMEKFVVVNSEGNVVAKSLEATNELQKIAINSSGTVRHEDFLMIQDQITKVRELALNGIADLEANGLSFDVPIETQLVGVEDENDFQDADQDMNPNASQNNDSVYTLGATPLPITHQGFSIPWRQNGFAYKQSTGAERSTRKVGERLEKSLFNGNDKIAVTFGSTQFPLYGYTNHPNRGQGTISDWTVLANVEKIVNEVNTEIGLMDATQGGVRDNSLILYVASDINQVFQEDYKTANPTSRTIKERLMMIDQVRDVKRGIELADGTAVLVEMDGRTIQLAKASDIVSIPHLKTAPMQPQAFTTYAAMVHQIKVDSNGNTGIRHLTQ